MTEPPFWYLGTTAWTAVIALATAGLVLVAAAAGFVALRQLSSSISATHEQTRAYVSADIETHPTHHFILEFVLRNSGRTAASDVRIAWDQTPVRAVDVGRQFADAKLFTNGIPTMAPGREIRIMFDSTIERYPRTDFPAAYTATISYTDIYQVRHVDTYVLDADIFKGTNTVGTKTVHDIGEAVRDIATAIKDSGFARGRLRVLTETSAEHDQREQARWQRWKDRQGQQDQDEAATTRRSHLAGLMRRRARPRSPL